MALECKVMTQEELLDMLADLEDFVIPVADIIPLLRAVRYGKLRGHSSELLMETYHELCKKHSGLDELIANMYRRAKS